MNFTAQLIFLLIGIDLFRSSQVDKGETSSSNLNTRTEQTLLLRIQLIIIIITNKWYMHNPTAVLENNTHKLLWDFDIQTDLPISARRPDLIVTNKKKKKKKKKKKRTCKIVDFAVPADHRIKLKESEKKVKYLDLAKEFLKNYGI